MRRRAVLLAAGHTRSFQGCLLRLGVQMEIMCYVLEVNVFRLYWEGLGEGNETFRS